MSLVFFILKSICKKSQKRLIIINFIKIVTAFNHQNNIEAIKLDLWILIMNLRNRSWIYLCYWWFYFLNLIFLFFLISMIFDKYWFSDKYFIFYNHLKCLVLFLGTKEMSDEVGVESIIFIAWNQSNYDNQWYITIFSILQKDLDHFFNQ